MTVTSMRSCGSALPTTFAPGSAVFALPLTALRFCVDAMLISSCDVVGRDGLAHIADLMRTMRRSPGSGDPSRRHGADIALSSCVEAIPEIPPGLESFP
jgi:hypothetical protein